jgi:tight adherence protein B
MTPKYLLILLVGGGIIMLALGTLKASKAARERQQRLDFAVMGTRAGETTVAAIEESEDASSNYKMLEKLLLLDTNHPWQLQVSIQLLVFSAAVAAGAVWALLHVFFEVPFQISACLSAAAAVLAPRTVLAWKRAKIEAAFAASFPSAIDTMARMLRVGLPITSAIRAVGQEAPAPTNTLFLRIANQMSIGLPLATALQSASQQVRLKDFRFFCAAVILQQSSGGKLVSTLEELSGIMQKRSNMRSRARAATSEVRFTAYVLAALPFIVIGAMMAAAPDYLQPLFTDKRGHLILAAGMGGLSLAYLIMRSMMRSINTD